MVDELEVNATVVSFKAGFITQSGTDIFLLSQAPI